MNPKQGLIASIFVVSCLVLPEQALAFQQKQVISPGLGIAGMANVGGSFKAVFIVDPWDASRPCEIYQLGAGGLDQDYEVIGTSETDWWTFASGVTVHCGHIMNVLNQNGYFIDFHTRGGNDVVFGGYGPNYTFSDGGNDLIAGSHGGGDSRTYGGPGNDVVRGANLGADLLYGDAGFDALCGSPSTTAMIMNGGPDTDSRCGPAVFVTNVENIDCAICGY